MKISIKIALFILITTSPILTGCMSYYDIDKNLYSTKILDAIENGIPIPIFDKKITIILQTYEINSAEFYPTILNTLETIHPKNNPPQIYRIKESSDLGEKAVISVLVSSKEQSVQKNAKFNDNKRAQFLTVFKTFNLFLLQNKKKSILVYVFPQGEQTKVGVHVMDGLANTISANDIHQAFKERINK